MSQNYYPHPVTGNDPDQWQKASPAVLRDYVAKHPDPITEDEFCLLVNSIDPRIGETLESWRHKKIDGFNVEEAIRRNIREPQEATRLHLREIQRRMGREAYEKAIEGATVEDWVALVAGSLIMIPEWMPRPKTNDRPTMIAEPYGVKASDLIEAFTLDASWRDRFKRLRHGLDDAITQHGKAPAPHLFNPVKVARIIAEVDGRKPKALLTTIKRKFPQWQDEAETELESN